MENKDKIFDKLINDIQKIGVETDRDNANVGNNFSSKLLRIASVANKTSILMQLPKNIAYAYEEGYIHIHDADSYNLTTNCLNIKTGEVLRKGFNTGYGTINPPKRIESAAELSCILLQSSQNDLFGGQAHSNFDNDMVEFLIKTEEEILQGEIKNAIEYGLGGLSSNLTGDITFEDLPVKFQDFIKKNVAIKLDKALHQAMQGITYNLNTMHSRAGSQVPFSSLNIGIPQGTPERQKYAAMICRAFLEEYEKGLGKGEQPIFPNIIFRVKKGVNKNPEDPYYDLYELACRVASKRMNPMFMNLDADFNLKMYNKGILPMTMGCRTYLGENINGSDDPAGRGNIAPTTINLPRIAIETMKCFKNNSNPTNAEILETFMKMLNDILELAKESLIHRYNTLKKLKAKDLPFVVGQKLMTGSEDLGPDDSIEPVLRQGTWGIGFIGLAETLTALFGKHHGEDKKIWNIGFNIISHIRNMCEYYKVKYKLNFACYATPAEGLSGRFIAMDKKKYGVIKGVTDKDYYTNSYHIPVHYKISIADKIQLEAPFHKICNGGHITYVELDGTPDADTVKSIIDYAYGNTNINYIGINFHMRYCRDCGTRLDTSETSCPKCESTNIQGISRVTGYLSLDERFGAGKVAERSDRLSHNGFNNNY